MKNLFLSVVLLLTVSVVFAGNEVEKVSTYNVGETIESTNYVNLTSADFISTNLNLTSELANSFDLPQIESIILSDDCSGITVTLGDGDSFVWSGSCAGLLRLIKAYLAME